MVNKYTQYSVEDFDSYDCLKLSKRFYILLLFVLRGYIVWLLSVTNMKDRISIIQWIYPETALFYLSLIAGTGGLFILLLISLRRPEAQSWVENSWKHCRKIMVVALLFDLIANIIGFFIWQLQSLSWLSIHAGISCLLIYLCYSSNRLTINLEEFPKKIVKD